MLNLRAYAAELVGTFALAFVVVLSIRAHSAMTPVLAGLTLGTMVYALGPISGAHLNPAVTIGLWSIKKIKSMDVPCYLIAQFIGGFLALVAADMLGTTAVTLAVSNEVVIYAAEAVAAAFLVFGISSVVHGKTPKEASGLVIGSSLLLGIMTTVSISNGVANPAVAVAIGSVSVAYLIGPVIGAVAAAWLYKVIVD